MDFTHFDSAGNAIMVDVSGKDSTVREAVACGKISMSAECFAMIKHGSAKKGDVLGTARIAGIMAAKRTSDLIPLCHAINLTNAAIEFELIDASNQITAICTAKTTGQTGVEMEALTGVSIALLTIYDMCKAVDRAMEIGGVYLKRKSGGNSGLFEAAQERGIT